MDNIGFCKFCGNSRILLKADRMTKEDRDNQASLECDCDGARIERDIQGYTVSHQDGRSIH